MRRWSGWHEARQAQVDPTGHQPDEIVHLVARHAASTKRPTQLAVESLAGSLEPSGRGCAMDLVQASQGLGGNAVEVVLAQQGALIGRKGRDRLGEGGLQQTGGVVA